MIQQWLQQVKDLIVQEVPPNISHCEFDCRSVNCSDCPFVQSCPSQTQN